ncbi:MAG: sulfotransferase family protein [Coraliomargaritaceae bacterium]
MIKPVFIVSLPRAGSTLLQRLIMGHPTIASCGEPWVALPLVYMLKNKGTIAEYGHHSAACSIESFVEGLPNGQDDYWSAVARFLSDLYALKAFDGATHFIDKTPRYYKILPEIRKIFPESPIFLLVRNPLGVFASMLNFMKGDLRYLPMWKNDWMEGHDRMAEAMESSDKKFHVVRFESLLKDPPTTLTELMRTLELEYVPSQMDELMERQLNRGDPTGSTLYKHINTAPLNSWRGTINSPAKKRLALNWLRDLPDDIWIALGYDKSVVIKDLQEHIPGKSYNVKDTLNWLIGSFYFSSGIHLLKKVRKGTFTKHRPFYN